MLNNILGNLFNNLNYKKNGTKENFYSFSEMDNLQWIEIHSRDISRPDGTSYDLPAKSQRLGRFIKVRLQSDRQQPKAQNKEPAARPIFFEPSNMKWIICIG
jgi:hypothetical protein